MALGILTRECLLPPFAVGGSIAVPMLVSRGLRTIDQLEIMVPSLRGASAAAGGIAGCAAALAAIQASSWWLVPTLAVWAASLTAAALCDAVTQRIPTALARQGAFGTSVLVVVAAIGGQDYSGLLQAAIACVSIGAILLLCWRVAGLGLGDVRLGILAGLGLGHTTFHGIAIAVATFSAITVAQAVVVLARGGTRRSTFPYGPALAVGVFMAAVS